MNRQYENLCPKIFVPRLHFIGCRRGRLGSFSDNITESTGSTGLFGGGGPIILPPPPSKEVVEWVLYKTKSARKKLPFLLRKGIRVGPGMNQKQEL
jgi:hypothetical protein